ncbi:MAG: hypothetical protein JW776_02995 [Candidatus Lokiarchaeota archaeon]|nr:hypothetical protein [Candidatus Lokiarchaeota archaeon]
MAKKGKQLDIPIKAALLKSPRAVIQTITSNVQGLKFTKVIQTYVMESNLLKIQLLREGRVFSQGDVIWVGNKENTTEGVVICYQADRKDMKQIIPNNDNTMDAILDANKFILKIHIMSRLRCAVCGKPIEIFDSELQCPICEAKGHSDHFREWIKMKSSCPVCKKALTLDKNEYPIMAED